MATAFRLQRDYSNICIVAKNVTISVQSDWTGARHLKNPTLFCEGLKDRIAS